MNNKTVLNLMLAFSLMSAPLAGISSDAGDSECADESEGCSFFSYDPTLYRLETKVKVYTIKDSMDSEDRVENRLSFVAEGFLMKEETEGQEAMNFLSYVLKFNFTDSSNETAKGFHMEEVSLNATGFRFGDGATVLQSLGLGYVGVNSLMRRAQPGHYDDQIFFGRILKLGGAVEVPFSSDSSLSLILAGVADIGTNSEVAARIGVDDGAYGFFVASEYAVQRMDINDRIPTATTDLSTRYIRSAVNTELGWKSDQIAVVIFKNWEEVDGRYKMLNGQHKSKYHHESDLEGVRLEYRY